MKTLYNKKGHPHSFEHSIDARDALKRGGLFAFPPGSQPDVPKSEQMGFDSMTKAQLVEWAANNHGAQLDVNNKKEILVEQTTELADRAKLPPAEEKIVRRR